MISSYKHTSAFSLIEILIGILVVSIVMVGAFQTLTSVGIGKVKIIEKTSIEKESFFAAEKLFEIIKKGGSIDYEEYWNRTSINMGSGPLYSSGHYARPTGFGNFAINGSPIDRSNPGDRLYFCLSKNGTSMPTTGCLDDFNSNWIGTTFDFDRTGHQQRYLQYQNQFIDYNSDADGDGGDENGTSDLLGYPNFYGDSDDEFLGIGPYAFTGSATSQGKVQELYLINKHINERTFLRLNVGLDPYAPSGATCTGTQVMTGSGCLGTIEILKLTGLDDAFGHGQYADNGVGGLSDNDGIIDTWLIHKDYDPNFGNNSIGATTGMDYILAHNGGAGYWQPLFSDKIHVSDVEFYVFPNKDPVLSWRDTDPNLQVTPYIQVKITLQPSWKTKRKIKGAIPDVVIATTIQLSELNFK